MALADGNRINTNIAALNALNALIAANRQLSIHQLRLSTGRRINEAADDPAGFSISHRLANRARGLSIALDSIGTMTNLLSVAEAGLQSINEILEQMRDLVIQAMSDTLGTNERNAIEQQLDDLAAEIDRIASQTSFNGVPLLDGTFTSKRFQTGDTGTDSVSFSISQNFSAGSLGIADASLDVSTSSLASTSLGYVDSAISTVLTQIQQIGSMVQRLRTVENNLTAAITNTEAAKARILDADVAREQLEATRFQILQQLSTAQLAQANVAPSSVLALFR